MTDANNEKYILQSAANTLDILDLLGRHEELSVPEIAALTGQSKSSVFRMMVTLEDRKYVKKSADARFRLGLKLAALGNHALENLNVAQRGHPYLTDLTARTGETSHMAVLDQDYFIRFVDKVISRSTIRTDSTIGFRRRAHLVGCGKALLAFQKPEYIDAYCKNVSFEPMTEFSLPDGDALKRELEEVRRRGVAFDRQESEYGLFCVAAPVLDSQGVPLAAVSVSGPADRMVRNLDAIVPQLLDAADQISRAVD